MDLRLVQDNSKRLFWNFKVFLILHFVSPCPDEETHNGEHDVPRQIDKGIVDTTDWISVALPAKDRHFAFQPANRDWMFSIICLKFLLVYLPWFMLAPKYLPISWDLLKPVTFRISSITAVSVFFEKPVDFAEFKRADRVITFEQMARNRPRPSLATTGAEAATTGAETTTTADTIVASNAQDPSSSNEQTNSRANQPTPGRQQQLVKGGTTMLEAESDVVLPTFSVPNVSATNTISTATTSNGDLALGNTNPLLNHPRNSQGAQQAPRPPTGALPQVTLPQLVTQALPTQTIHFEIAPVYTPGLTVAITSAVAP
ncbi:uncharacterized protein G2W53_004282 [Senna tora]|uniref:Uncharacterized protein n=1 Tax=Senna tora TaxID=362788 RepID=A0A834XCW5_9FABA|nr:uncharacterized protein G2W53_004282 [Senna tora]